MGRRAACVAQLCGFPVRLADVELQGKTPSTSLLRSWACRTSSNSTTSSSRSRPSSSPCSQRARPKSLRELGVQLHSHCSADADYSSSAIIEQYFTNSYSVSQRHVLLASLALAARELAGLPTLAAASKSQDVEQELFPSKRLPPQLHRRLAGSSSSNEGPVEAISADLTRMALSGARADAETSMPEAAREKLLTVRGTTRRSARLDVAQGAATTPTFATIAAETFILPLINRFWLYLRDTATSSLASRQSQSVGPYAGGAPAPMLLEPILLAKFLATLAVLVHAARHSPAFLAVIVPETLAFILAIKPAQTSAAAGTHAVDEDGGLDADLVVSSALELVLVVLDATVQLDGGRTLMSSSAANGEGGAIVAEIKDWAEEVFEREVRRGGDIGVGRPGRAAAGVLLRVEEIVGRWRVAVGW